MLREEDPIVEKKQQCITEPAAREAKKLYMRAWRKKNKDKSREHNNRYWNKKAAEIEAIRQQLLNDDKSERG